MGHIQTRLGMLAAIVTLTLIVSCESSRLSNIWWDRSFTSGPLTKIMVIAVKRNAIHRRIWEDGLADELSKHSLVVTPSYRTFPTDVPDTGQVSAALREGKFDAVLVVTKLPTQTLTSTEPGYTTRTPVYAYNAWRNSYSVSYDREYHSPTTDTSRVVRHQIDLWSAIETGRLIWSGIGEVLDPSSVQDVKSEISQLIAPELELHGIIPPVKKH